MIVFEENLCSMDETEDENLIEKATVQYVCYKTCIDLTRRRDDRIESMKLKLLKSRHKSNFIMTVYDNNKAMPIFCYCWIRYNTSDELSSNLSCSFVCPCRVELRLSTYKYYFIDYIILLS